MGQVTGDVHGAAARLQRELTKLKYPGAVDEVGVRLGDPVALLPLLHYVLLRFSRHVAQCIARAGYEMQGKADQRFVETAFRLIRDCFGVRTVLSAAQFLEQGYAERKVLLLCDVIQVCKKIHNDELRKERLAALKPRLGAPSSLSKPPEGSNRMLEVKVVKGSQETRQVVSPVHLPNAAGGGQSVYAVRRQISSPVTKSKLLPGVAPVTPASSNKRGSRAPSPSAETLPLDPSSQTWLPSQHPTAGQAWLSQQSRQQEQPTAWRDWEQPLPPGHSQEQVLWSAPQGLDQGSAWLQPLLGHMQPAAASQQVGAKAALTQAGNRRGETSAPWENSRKLPTVHSWFVNPAFAGSPTAAQYDADHAVDSGEDANMPASSSFAFPQSWGLTGVPTAAIQQQLPPPLPMIRANEPPDSPARISPDLLQLPRSDATMYAPGPDAATAQLLKQHAEHMKPWQQQQPVHQPLTQQPAHTINQDFNLNARAEHALGATTYGAVSCGTGAPLTEGIAATQQLQPPGQLPSAPAAAGSGQRPGQGQQMVGTMGLPGGQAVAATPPGMDAQLQEMRRQFEQQLAALQQRLERAEQELHRSRSEAEQAKGALQAQVTVLDGRVRFLECEVGMCVRVGDYEPAPQREAAITTSGRAEPQPTASSQEYAVRASAERPWQSQASTQYSDSSRPSLRQDTTDSVHVFHAQKAQQEQAAVPASTSGAWAPVYALSSRPLISATTPAPPVMTKLTAPQPSFGFQPQALMQLVASADMAAEGQHLQFRTAAGGLSAPSTSYASLQTRDSTRAGLDRHGGSETSHVPHTTATDRQLTAEAHVHASRSSIGSGQETTATTLDQTSSQVFVGGNRSNLYDQPGGAFNSDDQPQHPPLSSTGGGSYYGKVDQQTGGGSTSSLIESLVQRYTDAQNFLVNLRQSK